MFLFRRKAGGPANRLRLRLISMLDLTKWYEPCGSRRPHFCGRQWWRNCPCESTPHFRAILYPQGRTWNWTGPLGGAGHHKRDRRNDQRAQQRPSPQERHLLFDFSAQPGTKEHLVNLEVGQNFSMAASIE